MDFEKIRRVRLVNVKIAGDVVKIEYAPRRWDSAFVEAHNALLDSEDEQRGFPERGRERYLYTLNQVATGWDITQEGMPLPLNEEILCQVDDIYLFAFYSAIRQDVENREEEKNC